MIRRAVQLLLLALVLFGAYLALNTFSDHRLKVALDQAISRLPAGYTASYESVHYAMLTGHGSIRGVKIQHPAAPTFSLMISGVEIDHPDWDLGDRWMKAASDPTAVAPETALPVAGRLAAEMLSLQTDKTTLTADSLSIDGLRAYPWALLHPGLPSIADALATLSHPRPTPADLLPVLKMEAAYVLGIGYDDYTIRHYGGTLNIPATPATAATPERPEQVVNYTLAELGSGHGDRGVLDEGHVSGIGFTTGLNASWSIDQVRLSQMDLRQPAMRLLNGGPLDAHAADGFRLGSMRYDGWRVDVLGFPTVTMAGFELANLAATDGVLESGDIAIRALRLAHDDVPVLKIDEAFDMLGLQAVTVSLSAGYRRDLVKRRIDLHDTSLKIDELGALTLDATAVDLDPGAVPPSDLMTSGALAHALLRYTDASLTDRLMQHGARTMATDLAGFRVIAAKIVNGYAGTYPDSPELQQAAAQVIVFLNDPHSLTVELQPAPPVPFADLRAAASVPPPTLAKLLGVRVTANALPGAPR